LITSKIRVFYRYDGPTISDFMRKKLSREVVQSHLQRFPEEFSDALTQSENQPTVFIERENLAGGEIWVTTQVDIDVKAYDQALKQTLNGLDLFADQLEFSETR